MRRSPFPSVAVSTDANYQERHIADVDILAKQVLITQLLYCSLIQHADLGALGIVASVKESSRLNMFAQNLLILSLHAQYTNGRISSTITKRSAGLHHRREILYLGQVTYQIDIAHGEVQLAVLRQTFVGEFCPTGIDLHGIAGLAAVTVLDSVLQTIAGAKQYNQDKYTPRNSKSRHRCAKAVLTDTTPYFRQDTH